LHDREQNERQPDQANDRADLCENKNIGKTDRTGDGKPCHERLEIEAAKTACLLAGSIAGAKTAATNLTRR
jgi:hypothetical protein